MGITNKQRGRQVFAGGAHQSVQAYPSDGAIGAKSHIAVLTKATAGAYTLGASPYDGVELEIDSNTTAAHVVTATGLIQAGATGSPLTTMTWAAFPGGSVMLRGYGGKWIVVGKNGVTIT
jgi:hypothetical protein